MENLHVLKKVDGCYSCQCRPIQHRYLKPIYSFTSNTISQKDYGYCIPVFFRGHRIFATFTDRTEWQCLVEKLGETTGEVDDSDESTTEGLHANNTWLAAKSLHTWHTAKSLQTLLDYPTDCGRGEVSLAGSILPVLATSPDA